MAGYKTWAADDVLTAADLNGYLMAQAVPQFASAATRSAAILSPGTGQLTYRIDGAVYEYWNGTTWAGLVAGSATNAGNASYATTAGTAVNANKVGNITIFNSSSTPTANATGDLWFY